MLQPSRRGRWRFFRCIFDSVKAKMALVWLCCQVNVPPRPQTVLESDSTTICSRVIVTNIMSKFKSAAGDWLFELHSRGKHTRTHRHRHTTWAWKRTSHKVRKVSPSSVTMQIQYVALQTAKQIKRNVQLNSPFWDVERIKLPSVIKHHLCLFKNFIWSAYLLFLNWTLGGTGEQASDLLQAH